MAQCLLPVIREWYYSLNQFLPLTDISLSILLSRCFSFYIADPDNLCKLPQHITPGISVAEYNRDLFLAHRESGRTGSALHGRKTREWRQHPSSVVSGWKWPTSPPQRPSARTSYQLPVLKLIAKQAGKHGGTHSAFLEWRLRSCSGVPLSFSHKWCLLRDLLDFCTASCLSFYTGNIPLDSLSNTEI